MTMDDDKSASTGMGFTTGYVFGRMSARGSQRTAEFKEFVRQQRQGRQKLPYEADDVDSAIATWKAAVARRDATIAQLQAQLQESTRSNALLLQQLSASTDECRSLGAEVAKHEHDIGLLQNTIEGLMAMHDEELAELKAEIARLRGEA